MGNNENIFSPVTNGKIETYGNSQKNPDFLCPTFGIFCQLVVEATFLPGPERTFEAG